MTTTPADTRHPGPSLMNSPAYRPNGGPHGVLGAVGPRVLGRETPDNARGVVSAETEPDKLESPVTWMHWATHQLERVASAHGCVNRDYRAKLIRDVMAIASDDDCTFDLAYMSDLLIRQITANKERLDTMDAQPALPEVKPKSEPSAYQVWTEKFKDLYGESAGKEFARATSWKNWHDAKTRGTLSDAEIVAMLEAHVAQAKRTADLDAVLGPDTPTEPPAQKPAATAPASAATPAAVADVPATRNDAATGHAAAITATPAPTPEPAIVTPSNAPVVYGEASVVMYPMRSGEVIWHGYRWSLTIRTGATAADVQNVFTQWETVLSMPGVEIAADARYVAPQPLPQQAVTTTPAAPVLPTNGATPAPLTYAPLPETQPAPVATAGAPDKKGRVPGQTGTDKVTAIMRNETNGKSVIEVYCGGKYSDHKLRRDEDVALLRAALPTLDIAAMVAGTQYPVSATLTWRVTDKLNDKGTYWRDVVSIVA